MTTALYRRYRPETFADVIGQEHVTDPLRQALRSDRVTHAYLFSGPRGCGKTTSARILARCLNCVEGPTDSPCGACDSCVELARDGSGSLDVVEIDAASHNGVDDARELRERALFAPARDRYKIFILDEAHMVTSQGFNALLKLVEEPPPHVKFVFATTEPEKVIGTIRSRTHHYPFRLVPPEALISYLEFLCEKEGVQVGSGVLPLVVRAGGGSVRDTLSVLDQLMAGAGEGGVDYDLAATLLGYTPDSLLDGVVSAVAARDGASVFQIVDRIIESGHDPRRFVEDLLERFRDLVVISAAGEHAEAIMRGVPADQLDRMRSQSTLFTPADISKAADTTNTALSEMTGATSPRLHLELLCARLLLISAPAAGAPALASGSKPELRPELRPTPEQRATPKPERGAEPSPTPEQKPASKPEPESEAARKGQQSQQSQQAPATAEPKSPAVPEATPPESTTREPAPSESAAGKPIAAEPVTPQPAAEPAAESAGLDANLLRQRWPEVLETLGRLRRVTWVLVSQNAQVVDVSETTVRLGFSTQALANTFASGPHADFVREAVAQTLGADLGIEPVLGSQGGNSPAGATDGVVNPGRGGSSGSGAHQDSRRTSWDAPSAERSPEPPAASGWDSSAAAQPREFEQNQQREPGDQAQQAQRTQRARREQWPEERSAPPTGATKEREVAAASQIAENGRSASANAAPPEPMGAEYDESSDDDEILENSDSVGIALVQREMGGEIIEEIIDE